MTETKLPPQLCPHCGELISAATGVLDGEDTIPEPGNYCLCIYCSHLLRFSERMTMLLVTADEMRTLRERDPDLHRKLRYLQAVALMRDAIPTVRRMLS